MGGERLEEAGWYQNVSVCESVCACACGDRRIPREKLGDGGGGRGVGTLAKGDGFLEFLHEGAHGDQNLFSMFQCWFEV
jgi:hypothetical protein